MSTISDSEKARRYRRKLVDLLEAAEGYFKSPTRARHETLHEEMRVIRTQLDVEEKFGEKSVEREVTPT